MNTKSTTMRIDLIPEISDIPLSERPKAVPIVRMGGVAAAPSAAAARPAAAAASSIPASGGAANPPLPAFSSPPTSRIEAVYEELFQNIYDAAVVTDLHGRVRIANKRATAAFGYTAAQLSHLSLSELVSGVDAELVRTMYENLRRETFSLLQASCVRSDGSRFPAEIAGSPIRLSTPHLCFLVRDETRRRQEGEMLRTEHNALQNASDAIVVVGLDTRIEYANPATARIWGKREAGDLVGCPVGDLLLNPADGKAIIDSLAGETWDTVGETDARRDNGETFRVEVRASCNRDSDGNAIGAVLSLSDLTERDRVAAAEHDAETLRAAIDSFVAFHRSAKYNTEELAVAFSAISEALGACADPALRALLPRMDAASGNLAALRSLAADAEELAAKFVKEAP